MDTHEVIFKFEGMLADRHVLDASDANGFHEGARQLLALHAYGYVHGHEPKGGVVNHTAHYRVLEAAPVQGCIEYHYVVELVQSFGNGFAEAAGAFTFGYFLQDQLKAMFGRKSSSEPPLLPRRGNPTLVASRGNGEPLVDTEQEALIIARRFQERGRNSAATMMRPVGRSAERVTIRVARYAPLVLTADDLLFLKQLEIAQAIDHMRQQDFRYGRA